MFSWFRKFESNRVFTGDEAWGLFRLAAIGEACGWGLLICGILLEKYVWPQSPLPVYFAGRTHGILFLAYMLAAVGLYPNLKWPRWKALIALAASVPPFGSLIFEQLEQYYQKTAEFKNYRRCVALAVLAQ
jgi:integral membrane protein